MNESEKLLVKDLLVWRDAALRTCQQLGMHGSEFGAYLLLCAEVGHIPVVGGKERPDMMPQDEECKHSMPIDISKDGKAGRWMCLDCKKVWMEEPVTVETVTTPPPRQAKKNMPLTEREVCDLPDGTAVTVIGAQGIKAFGYVIKRFQGQQGIIDPFQGVAAEWKALTNIGETEYNTRVWKS